jgi:hypothetical protein
MTRKPECVFYGDCLDYHAHRPIIGGREVDDFDCRGCQRYVKEDRMSHWDRVKFILLYAVIMGQAVMGREGVVVQTSVQRPG